MNKECLGKNIRINGQPLTSTMSSTTTTSSTSTMSTTTSTRFIEVGKIYNFPKGGYLVKRIHIVAEINDNGNELIVFKRWSPRKQYWSYQIEDRCSLDYFAENGHITKIR